MPSLGFAEIIIIGILALIVIGPERLPHATRQLGKLYGMFRRQADELRRALVLEADRMDEEDRLRDLSVKRKQAESRARAEANAVSEDTVPQTTPPPEVHSPQAEDGVAPPGGEVVPENPPHEDPDHIPPGFSEPEWDELPDHIKAIVRERSAGNVGPS